MKSKNKILASAICLLMVVLCIFGMSSCGVTPGNENTECTHTFGEWTEKTSATCAAPGVKERVCSACGETETADIEALAHDFADATCTAPKTCKVCAATEGNALGHDWTVPTCTTPKTCKVCHEQTDVILDHVYDQEIVKAEAACDEASCTSAATYFRSCSCGAVSNDTKNTFAVGEPVAHAYTREEPSESAQKSPATCTSAAVYYLSCSCGAISTADADTFTYGDTVPHRYTLEIVNSDTEYSPATCTSVAVYYLSCSCGEISYDASLTFESGSTLKHTYSEIASTPATCLAPATKTYECVCGDRYIEEVDDALNHDINGVTPVEKHLGGCEYVLIYTCAREGCGMDVEGNHVYNHKHVAGITTAATCKQEGIKTLLCECGDTLTEKIAPDATGHSWITGVPAGNVRVDTCAHCGETKNVTVYEGTETERTDAKDFADTEIELNNANISLDSGVIDKIGDDKVVLSADKVTGDDRESLGLSDYQLGQVGNSPIYNFTISGENGPIAEFGEDNYVTITLPYELAEGEDVDSIAIWFINDYGELESIKATYNNGFVTFKTNHFSYYTVTRLTPEERCALYGHNYTAQHVDGSCTKDSYDMYLCVRCHDKYIDEDSRVVADGHDYQVTVDDATCTAPGYEIYSCADCGHSYRIKINATGHSWSIVDSAVASCTQNGFTKYGCDGCDEEYSIVVAKLAHSYTVTTVPATCENGGYDLHACASCGDSYTDNYVAAIGHRYENPVWTWAIDNSSATLTLVCENDETHVSVTDAKIGVTVISGVCSNFRKTTYTASVYVNGEIYTDEKSVESGTPDHIFSPNWSTDGDYHWRECVCGEKTDYAEHSAQSVETVVAPTCGADGLIVEHCVCGRAEEKRQPATGEHSYAEGVCTVCGKAEASCDHTKLHAESIDFGDFGGCSWILNYFSCECGEVKIIDTENSDIACDFEYTEMNQGVDENGNQFQSASGYCTECNVTFSIYAVMVMDGCLQSISQDYSFNYNGELVIAASYTENYVYHKNQQTITVNLADYGACGGTAVLYYCATCDTNVGMSRINATCNASFNSRPETEELVDENGVTHYIQRVACPDCGLELKIDIWYDYISDCVTTMRGRMTIICGENVILDIYDEETEMNHKSEYSYEMHGDSCTDGVKVVETCSVCGTQSYYVTYSHDDVDERVTVDYSDYTSCGFTVTVDVCNRCGKYTYIYNVDTGCNVGAPVEEELRDEQGNLIGYREVYTCADCGLVFIEQEIYVVESDCVVTEIDGSYVYYGDTCIFEYTEKEVDEHHNYHYEYRLDGATCSDGGYYTAVCSVCGDSFEGRFYNHSTESATVDFSQYGCGGSISGDRCTICGVFTNLSGLSIDCPVNQSPTPDQIYDANDVLHLVNDIVCPVCGLRFVTDSYSSTSGGCSVKENYTLAVYCGDECIAKYASVFTSYDHDYETTYHMYGDDCEDGYEERTVCKICGSGFGGTIYYHKTEHFEINLSEHGCEGIISGDRCTVCDKITDIEQMNIGCKIGDGTPGTYVDDMGVLHNVITATCPDCGLTFTTDEYVVIESVCESVEYYVMRISKGDLTVFEQVDKERISTHNYKITYEFMGESCDDGYYINSYCDKCQESDSEFYKGHNVENVDYNLKELGLCGGYVEISTCTACGMCSYAYTDEHCYWNEVSETADGYTVYSCEYCNAMKLYRRTEHEKDYNCKYLVEYSCIYLVDGVEVLRYEYSNLNEDHRYINEFVLNGTTCNDGYTRTEICVDCGRSWTQTSSGHDAVRVYICEPTGGCDHGLSVYSCACGYDSYFNIDNYGSMIYNDKEQCYSCPDCGLNATKIKSSEQQGCYLVTVTELTLVCNGETLYSIYHEDVFENHEFANVSAAQGSDGMLTLVASCKYCDKVVYSNVGTVTMEHHPENSDQKYYFDYYLTAETYGSCTIEGLNTNDTYVILYKLVDGKLVQIDYNDDGAGNGQFRLTCMLEAGVTYVYRIGFYGYDEEGVVSFSLSHGNSSKKCEHREYGKFDTLLGDSLSCEDGVVTGYVYNGCGCFCNISILNTHEIFRRDSIDLTEYGACMGMVSHYSCACGSVNSYDLRDDCAYIHTDNEYYDGYGRLVTVNVWRCETCGLRYTDSYYTVLDYENCTETKYYTVNIVVGEQLIAEYEFEVCYEKHDNVYRGELMNGESSSCYDGAIIYATCRTCGNEASETTYTHTTYPSVIVNIAELGSVCGGYAEFHECACGEKASVSFDHALCDFDTKWCELWVDDAVTSSQYNINGYSSFDYNSYIYTCAVTDPACAFKIRYADYYIKDANSCYAYRYITCQFGYNEQTGEYLSEYTYKIGARVPCHNYVHTDENKGDMSGSYYDCPDCGSYYHDEYYYDQNGNTAKYERTVLNTLDYTELRTYHEIEEYGTDHVGERYQTREYVESGYADGRKIWSEYVYTREEYVADFGDYGYKYTSTRTDSDKNYYYTEKAYVQYKGYSFVMYEYTNTGDYWERYDYTYNFDNGCTVRCVYTTSDGELNEEVYNSCRMYNDINIIAPTCTQSGLMCQECVICGYVSEAVEVTPLDHAWVRITDGFYYCFNCGLENANGASGDVIMEDLTDAYGNGEYYVAGYYVESYVEFTYYVGLVLPDGAEYILDGVNITTVDGIRAFAVSKAEIAALAESAGIAEYDVRFTFVPYGSDGSLDYAITFAEPTAVSGVIIDSVSFVDYIDSGETKYYIITPTVGGPWTFTTMANADTYGVLYTENHDTITSNDDDGYNSNFKITYELKAGETYILAIRHYGGGLVGECPILFICHETTA